MTSLFRGLTKSSSIETIDLADNDIRIDGIRSMVPFLEHSPYLENLALDGNVNIDSECFGVLMRALNENDRIKRLFFMDAILKIYLH